MLTVTRKKRPSFGSPRDLLQGFVLGQKKAQQSSGRCQPNLLIWEKAKASPGQWGLGVECKWKWQGNRRPQDVECHASRPASDSCSLLPVKAQSKVQSHSQLRSWIDDPTAPRAPCFSPSALFDAVPEPAQTGRAGGQAGHTPGRAWEPWYKFIRSSKLAIIAPRKDQTRVPR